MKNDLPERTQGLYDRLKVFPEAEYRAGGTVMKPDAWNAFLDLRQLLEREIIRALEEHRGCGDYVNVSRLSPDAGKGEGG